jgi:RNA polymerase sigma-70 factor, ECF subfamily
MSPDERIREAYDRGCAAHPAIRISFEFFLKHWNQVVSVDGGQEIFDTDLFLCAACLAGDNDAMDRVNGLLSASAQSVKSHFRVDDDERDEILQSVRIRLLSGPQPRLAGYRGASPLTAWLSVVVRRAALDAYRSSREPSSDQDILDLVADGVSPLHGALETDRERLRFFLETSLMRLEPQERTLLKMNLLDHQSIDAIGLVFRVHRATVARWLVDIRMRLLKDLVSLMKSELRTNSTEIQSLIRYYRSDLEMSLSRVLDAR